MRWRTAGNILLFAVNILYAQTYVIKFKDTAGDSTVVRSLLEQALGKTQSPTGQTNAFSIRPLAPTMLPSTSGFPWHKYSILRFPQKQSDQVIQSIAVLSSVEYIQPRYTYSTYSFPDDSAFSSQWNLRRIGISSLWQNGTINASLPAVKVGVVDTGIDDGHPDLQQSIALNPGETGNGKEKNGIDDDGNGFIDDWKGYDFVEGDSEDIGDWKERDNAPYDENGHGTAVSGIIGAQTNNGIGLSGIMPVRILPLRAFGKNGNGNDIDISSAIVYAADNGADVINLSFGDVVQSPLLHDAIRYAYSRNVVLVASSGNDGSNYPHYPSDFTEVISTGSTGQYDARSFFSSYSPSLDLMAPGEQIVTTTLGGGYTDQFAGTSAAAPHVSGVSAVIKSLEKKKKLSTTAYVELSNEEIRGILLNSADDAGEKGWDKFHGSGIVNAAKAVQSVSGSTVVIHSPFLDEILTGNAIPIIITASTPYVRSVHLYYGAGENPDQWIHIKSYENKIFVRDTFAVWDVSSLIPNSYLLRLLVKNSRGNDQEFRLRVVIDPSNPKILSFRFRDSVIIGNEYGSLVEARVDRNAHAALYYRKTGENLYRSIQSLGMQMNHSFLLTSQIFLPGVQYEMYCDFVENSSQKRSVKFFLTDSIGSTLSFSSRPIASSGFVNKSYSLPKGFLLNSVQRITGKPNIIVSEYNNDNEFGKLKMFEFSNGDFSPRDSSVRTWVPRSFLKNSGEGQLNILVQDRGVSQLLRVDTLNGKFVSPPLWGDSSDIWASQLLDLNGDMKPEIIARNSIEYLIYRNDGNNVFTLAARLVNPSHPLIGEARNQFGPPRSIAGDFTNSGRTEIVFADYDGDMMMYRQTAKNSLDFELAGIDSTYLHEMSDYIASGDFNGDNIPDVAVAGHSSLDWNQDREYDVPVWTVRVFSHRPADASGKLSLIWEQHFIGVKAGTGYDNGLMSGRLKAGDGKDALFISLNPQLYVFEWNPLKNTFESKWTHPSQSNSVVVYDFDGDSINDLGFHSNGRTEFWSLPDAAIIPAPFGLSATPMTPSKIKLRWSSSSSLHRVYRGTNADSLHQIAAVTGYEWIDSTVAAETKYFYAVSAVNAGESSRSEIVHALPHAAPRIVSVAQVSLSQLNVGLTFDISSGDLGTAIFLLDSATVSSSVVWASPRKVLVTFPGPVPIGVRTIKIRQLTDASGMSGDTAAAFSFTASMAEQRTFFARSGTLISPEKIRIEFSEQPDFITAKNPVHYSVYTIARPFVISSIDSTQPHVVTLNMRSGSNLSDLALRIEIRASEQITSQAGAPLNAGKGQVLSIAQETESMERIVVYPNPAKYSQRVSFVNIPANSRITIYSPYGEKVKVFDEKTTAEGIAWDLRNGKGDRVSTGIYLYRVEKMNNSNEVSGTVLGKFAVIR